MTQRNKLEAVSAEELVFANATTALSLKCAQIARHLQMNLLFLGLICW